MSDRVVPSLPAKPPVTSLSAGRRRLRSDDQSGAAVLEFALVIPVFVVVLYGLIFFGMLLATKQSLTNAAAEAARSSVGAIPGPGGGGPAGETQDQAVVRVATASIASRLGSIYDSPPPQIDFCDRVAGSGPKCITVIVQRNSPPVPPAPGLGIIWGSSKHLSSTAVVQYSA